MPAAGLPADEEERLATLASYRIMDTADDTFFDQLVELTAQILGMPMAAMTLVDADRQWLKARVGLDVRHVPREDAFCAHTILQPDQLLVVENATLDPRFKDNHLVTGDLHLRFYAGAPVRAADGQPLGALCVLDVKPRVLDSRQRHVLRRLATQAGALLELHRQNDLQQAAATHDMLTGLANRRWFESLLGDAMEGALTGLPCGVIVLDLDHFAAINDSLGHGTGDTVLREVTRRLQDCIRGTDLLGRLGGDEFGVLVSGPVDLDDVTVIAGRIERALDGEMRAGNTTVTLRASIGLAVAPIHGLDAPSLLRGAEQALYDVKLSGRQAIRTAHAGSGHAGSGHAGSGQAGSGQAGYGPEGSGHDGPASNLIRLRALNLALQTDLIAALAANDLHFDWQPIFTAQQPRCIGYEALLRWDRAGHGPVPPSTFIPVAEETGLIGRLDAWVLEHACIAAAAWSNPVLVSVNMSAHWFGRAELIRLLRGVLSRSGLAPERLVIELTERTLVQHTAATLRCLNELRAMGVRLALDDFGIGYSSFGYLRQFAFDELKLDRDFVRPLGGEKRAEAIAKAIVELGHSMNMAVVAEGVETQAQLACLQAMGCDYVQGYLLGRPMAEVAAAPAADTQDLVSVA